MPRKTKETQKKTPEESNNRDNFLTPRYATELLLPFIPDKVEQVWECAAGDGHMAKVFFDAGFRVIQSDIRENKKRGIEKFNFLTEVAIFNQGMIATNPPFSLKTEFYKKCRKYNLPFALLMPSDYSGWLIDAFDKDGAERITPKRRIDYLTPNILKNINNIIKTKIEDLSPSQQTKKNFLKSHGVISREYEFIEQVPVSVIRKFSSSDFHSYWVTWGFNIGKQETFVELTNEMKNNIF